MELNESEILGFLIGSIDILRMEKVDFTEKSRNKLADKIERNVIFL